MLEIKKGSEIMFNISLEKIFVFTVFGTIASMILVFIVELLGMGIFSILMAFYKRFLQEKYKEKLPLYKKCLEKFQKFHDEEHILLIALYPLSLFGRYFLPYILILIFVLECIFILSIFQYPSIRPDERFLYILVMILVISVIFTILTFGMLFYKKIQSSTTSRNGYRLLDKIVYICSSFGFVYEFYQLSLDEESIVNGFLTGISDKISEIGIFGRFMSVLIIIFVVLGHYKSYFLFQKYFMKKKK